MSEENQVNTPEEEAQNVEEATVDASETQEEPTSEANPVAELEAKLAAAEQKAAENWDTALRVKADMENLKRRTEKDLDSARKFALEKMANELLAVRDSMELGLQAAEAENADVASIVEGTQLTLKMFGDVMDKFNITQVDPVGEKFNPDQHQAMTMQPSEEHEPNTVISVMQKGYLLNDRLLRPALVIVSKKP